VDIALLLLAALGHGVIWAGAVNRINSTGLLRWQTKTLTTCCHVCMVAIPVALVAWLASDPAAAGSSGSGRTLLMARGGAGLLYIVPCWAMAIYHLSSWLVWRLTHRTSPVLRSNHTTLVDLRELVDAPAGNWFGRLLLNLPLNETLTLSEHEKTIEIPRLPSALDGLSIVHATDFHFTRRFDKSYYEALVDRANAMDGDLIVLTGDLFDDIRCFDWIEDTLGRLRARHGVYFVLGNHDLRTRQVDEMRRRLVACGLVDLSRRWLQIEVCGQAIVLAGNELPWIWPAADVASCPPRAEGGPLRIALSHSPDQLAWAQEHDIDLLVAGHTHGGQVRIPLIGAIYCPSRFGVRLAMGTFYKAPTVMHVSRGISAKLPIRWNCPPELAKLVLKSKDEGGRMKDE
jgi:hypothetical protein